MENTTWTVVVGAQAGDEGKAKVTHKAAADAEIVVRYQGGPNAGHTVNTGSKTLKFHQTPSGLAHPGKLCIMGPGMVLDPPLLLSEIAKLVAEGIDVSSLRISRKAHAIMPWHITLDGADEADRGAGKIGTTKKGIGPTYADKMSRSGIRMGDLVDREALAAKLRSVLPRANRLLSLYGQPLQDHEQVLESYHAAALQLAPYITDTDAILSAARRDGKSVLFEGAQGTFLDVDHGTYPFVTSSTPTAGGACSGSGIGPTMVDAVLGVSKSFFTRVGEGPFPTEQEGDVAQMLAQLDKPWAEKGTTTGRLRRCGWLDLVLLRYSTRVNGTNFLAVTKLDTLDQFEEVNVCTAYRVKGSGQVITEIDDMSAGVLAQMEPIYTTLPGWNSSTFGCPSFGELPDQARAYLNFIESNLGVQLAYIGVGPACEHTIELINPMKLGRRSLPGLASRT